MFSVAFSADGALLATAGSDAKLARAGELGADHGINYAKADFVAAVKALTARRGVDVKLVLPGKTDNAMVFHAGRAHYQPLLEAGVKIFERKERLLHAKSAVIDGVWSTVGSTNLDWRSLAYNDELNAVVLGPEFAGKMRAIFDKDVANSEAITREEWARRPFMERVKETAAVNFSELL